MTTNRELFNCYEEADRGGTGQGGVDPRREELFQKGSVDTDETSTSSTEPGPAGSGPLSEKPHNDPLLDIEVDKFGT